MSSYYYHSERREQHYSQNPGTIIRSGLPPLPTMFSPAIYGGSFLDDVGNGQQSSYSERIYTLPGYMSYYERIG